MSNGPVGSIGNPIIMKAGQIFGPKGEYGLRLGLNGNRTLGQFIEQVELLGVTLYMWVQV